MSDDQLPDVPALQVLEPPPGGLPALRARLEDEPRHRLRWWAAAFSAAALALLVLVLVWNRGPAPDAAPPPAEASALPDPTVGGTDVAFYWVSSTPGPQHATTQAIELPTVSVQDAPQVGVVAVP